MYQSFGLGVFLILIDYLLKYQAFARAFAKCHKLSDLGLPNELAILRIGTSLKDSFPNSSSRVVLSTGGGVHWVFQVKTICDPGGGQCGLCVQLSGHSKYRVIPKFALPNCGQEG